MSLVSPILSMGGINIKRLSGSGSKGHGSPLEFNHAFFQVNHASLKITVSLVSECVVYLYPQKAKAHIGPPFSRILDSFFVYFIGSQINFALGFRRRVNSVRPNLQDCGCSIFAYCEELTLGVHPVLVKGGVQGGFQSLGVVNAHRLNALKRVRNPRSVKVAHSHTRFRLGRPAYLQQAGHSFILENVNGTAIVFGHARIHLW